MSLGLAVALGAVLGAPARYLLDAALSRGRERPWPYGILVVNLLGCAAAGLLAGSGASESTTRLLGLGFLGSFTTASTVAWDVLVAGGRTGAVLLALHVGPGLALAGAGFAIGSVLT